MNNLYVPALLLGTLLALGACTHDGDPAQAAAEGTREATRELRAKMDTVREKVRNEMATEDLELDSEDPAAPEARITPAGDLYIGGEAVVIDDAQRALLLDYRGRVAEVAAAGAEIGVQGASVATEAVGSAIAAVFSGESGDEIGKRIEAEIEPRIRAAVAGLCAQLPPLLETQQALTESLPRFAPYADVEGNDFDDCMDETVADGSGNEASEAEAASGP